MSRNRNPLYGLDPQGIAEEISDAALANETVHSADDFGKSSTDFPRSQVITNESNAASPDRAKSADGSEDFPKEK